MNDLYDHQKVIVKKNPKKWGLWLGTGSGKTRTALCLCKGSVLVIAPKTQVEDKNWEREADSSSNRYPADFMTVISKETFRRDWDKLPRFNTVIIDEAHTCLGVTPSVRWKNKKPVPKASQLFDALDAYIAKHKPERIYPCTATIVRNPMTVWGAEKILGIHDGSIQNFRDFREEFYTKLPMPGREVWVPKQSEAVKKALAIRVRAMGSVGRLEDFFDVPDQTYRTVHVGLSEKQKKRMKEIALEYPDPLVLVGKRHQIENGVLAGDEFNAPEVFPNEKIDKLVEFAAEFPKMVVFVKYRAQIDQIQAAMKREKKKVLTLTGDTKNRGEVILEARNSEECVFLCQAQISAGWELPEYPVMVFASRTHSFVDYDQAIGRIQRANAIKKNLYINLVVKGGVDEAVDRALTNKQDFNEALYAKRI